MVVEADMGQMLQCRSDSAAIPNERQCASDRAVVIILHYGRAEVTRRLHQQLLDSDPGWRDRIMVLDNHAQVSYPRSWRRLESNLFWAGALDYVLHLGRDNGWSHIWFLNNDAFFISPPPHLERSWQRLRMIEKTTGPVGLFSPSFEQHPYHPQMIASNRHVYRRAKLIDGVAPLINLACWQAVGGLDCKDNAQGYGVDLYFSLRASRAGWPVIVDHQVRMRHVHHSSARSVPGFLESAGRAEKLYLQSRLGPEFARIIQNAQTSFVDEVRL